MLEKMQLECKVCSGAKFSLWLFSPVNHAFIPKKVKQWRQQGVIIGFWLLPLSFTILPVPWKHLLENNIVLIITQPVQPCSHRANEKQEKLALTKLFYYTLFDIFFRKTNKQYCKHKTTYQLMHDAFFLTQTEFAITISSFF